jgi:beta-phosphoglucomutase
MALKAVIFDMDGVLCSTDEYHYQSWKYVMDAYKIPFSRDVNEHLRGLTRRRSLEVILDGEQLPEADIQAILELKNQKFLDLIQKMSSKELMAGVGNLLEELRQAGIKIGIASASRNVKIVLERLGIARAIDAYCDGNVTRRSKPSPEVYLATAASLEVYPNECLAIEDSQAGIQAARSAGMCVIGLGPEDRVKEAHAWYKDLSSVRLED